MSADAKIFCNTLNVTVDAASHVKYVSSHVQDAVTHVNDVSSHVQNAVI